jgi:hypothetical protein
MNTVFFKLKFKSPDMRNTQGSAWIIPGNHSRDSDDWPLLTPHCATLGELESHIDKMQAELEEIREQGRKKFADARSVQPESN